MGDVTKFPVKHQMQMATAEMLRDLADMVEDEFNGTGVIVLIPMEDGKVEVVSPKGMLPHVVAEHLWNAWRGGSVR